MDFEVSSFLGIFSSFDSFKLPGDLLKDPLEFSLLVRLDWKLFQDKILKLFQVAMFLFYQIIKRIFIDSF
jgi:hypothetical protein